MRVITKTGFFFAAAALLLFIAPACRKAKVEEDNKKNQRNAGESVIEDIDATHRGTFACINLATGEVKQMKPEDAKNSKEWDLAVSTFFFKTNSGDSGPGNGGAFLTKTEETKDLKLEDYKTLPTEEQWVIDKEGLWNSKAAPKDAPMEDRYGEFSETGVNPELTAQYKNVRKYFFSEITHYGLFTPKPGMPPDFRMEEGIFFVRCADGKIAKCRIDYSGSIAYHYKLTYIYDVK